MLRRRAMINLCNLSLSLSFSLSLSLSLSLSRKYKHASVCLLSVSIKSIILQWSSEALFPNHVNKSADVKALIVDLRHPLHSKGPPPTACQFPRPSSSCISSAIFGISHRARPLGCPSPAGQAHAALLSTLPTFGFAFSLCSLISRFLFGPSLSIIIDWAAISVFYCFTGIPRVHRPLSSPCSSLLQFNNQFKIYNWRMKFLMLGKSFCTILFFQCAR